MTVWTVFDCLNHLTVHQPDILLFHTVASENSLKLNLICVLLSVKQHDWLIYDELTIDFKFLTTWWRYILSSLSSGLLKTRFVFIFPAVWNTNSFHLFALWSCENKPHSGERWRSATRKNHKTNTASYKKLLNTTIDYWSVKDDTSGSSAVLLVWTSISAAPFLPLLVQFFLLSSSIVCALI